MLYFLEFQKLIVEYFIFGKIILKVIILKKNVYMGFMLWKNYIVVVCNMRKIELL